MQLVQKKSYPVHNKRTPCMRRTKTQSRTPPTRPYPLHKKIKILFLGGYVYDGTNSKQTNRDGGICIGTCKKRLGD